MDRSIVNGAAQWGLQTSRDRCSQRRVPRERRDVDPDSSRSIKVIATARTSSFYIYTKTIPYFARKKTGWGDRVWPI